MIAMIKLIKAMKFHDHSKTLKFKIREKEFFFGNLRVTVYLSWLS